MTIDVLEPVRGRAHRRTPMHFKAREVAAGLPRRLPRPIPWTGVHLLTLTGAAVFLLAANRNQWFFGDEWAFIVNRSPSFADLDLWAPHNDHWSTTPILVFWGLLSTVGLTSYLPYAACMIAVHLLLTHLLWRVCLRMGVSPVVATSFTAVFAVLGAGYENLLWAFQMGIIASVAFGWAAVLLHDHDGPFDRRRDGLGWLASLLALLSNGPGIVMVGVAVLTVGLRRRSLRDTLLVASVPGAVFVGWYLVEGRNANRVPQPPGSHWGVVDWTWHGLAYAVDSIMGMPQVGGILVLAMIAWWMAHTDLIQGRTAVACTSAVGCVGFYLMTATGRAGLGLGSATASRYVYVAAALLLPTAALIVTRSVPKGVAPLVAVLGVTALIGFHNVAILRTSAGREAAREQAFKAFVVDAADTMRTGDDPPWVPSDSLNPDLTPTKLREVIAYGYLD